jgi:hypothetical protein
MIGGVKMDRIRLLEHKGKKIFYIDYSNLSADMLTSLMEEVIKQITSQPKKSELSLANFENTRFNADTISKFKAMEDKTFDYMKGSAVIGIKGLQKIAYDAVMRVSKNMAPLFSSDKEALDWLVERD